MRSWTILICHPIFCLERPKMISSYIFEHRTWRIQIGIRNFSTSTSDGNHVSCFAAEQGNWTHIELLELRVKVKLSLCLTNYYPLKACGGVDVEIHIFLTSVLVGEWSASRPCCFTRREITPGNHWIGGWVDPKAGLDDVEKRKFLTLPGLELRSLGCPAHSQSL
jgi:hypothetical protein